MTKDSLEQEIYKIGKMLAHTENELNKIENNVYESTAKKVKAARQKLKSVTKDLEKIVKSLQ